MKRIILALFLFNAVTLFAAPAGLDKKVAQKVRAKQTKQAFLVGGSCDLGENFVVDFNAWNAFLLSKGWQVHGFIDTDKQTELADVKPFVWKDFLTALKAVKGEKTKQVLIVILTHGNYKQGQHGVCDQSKQYQPVSELDPILSKLEGDYIQTAVIDASCYSGYSVIELANSSCVMSMAGKFPGTGAITVPVAEGLQTMATVSKKVTVEDVWLSVLNHSVKRKTQVPLISGFPKTVNVYQRSGFNVETIYISEKSLSEGKEYFDDNQALFSRLFSAEAMQGIADYFKTQQFFAQAPAVPAVFYLKQPQNARPCAKFYF